MSPCERTIAPRGYGVSSLENHEAYRFVVIYRKEPREIRDAESQWRGTLVPVPDNGNADNEQRRAFSDLDEIGRASCRERV